MDRFEASHISRFFIQKQFSATQVFDLSSVLPLLIYIILDFKPF